MAVLLTVAHVGDLVFRYRYRDLDLTAETLCRRFIRSRDEQSALRPGSRSRFRRGLHFRRLRGRDRFRRGRFRNDRRRFFRRTECIVEVVAPAHQERRQKDETAQGNAAFFLFVHLGH